MKLKLQGDNVLIGQARRSKAELRLALMLGRFGDKVGGVTLHLSKSAGSDGVKGMRCQIAVALKPKRVRVECTDAVLTVALERAAVKAVRVVARILDKERSGSVASPLRRK